MLAKHFAVMQSKDWDNAPRNTNGVECANCFATSGFIRPALYAAMQSLYEKDKQFALQYIAAGKGSKVSYRNLREDLLREHCSSIRMCEKTYFGN